MWAQDPVLLKTRSQILRAEGFAVVPILSLSQAIGYLLEGDFDLILFMPLNSRANQGTPRPTDTRTHSHSLLMEVVTVLRAKRTLPERHGGILAVGVRSSQLGPVPCALFFLFGSSHFSEFVD
jgi:hypothetical protein